MKNKISLVVGGLVALSTFGLASAQAAPRANTTEKNITISRSAPTYSSADVRFGLGLSNMAGLGMPAVSAMIDVTPVHSIQFIFGLANAATALKLSTGLYYRANLIGSQAAGFHVGGGMQVGVAGGTAAFGISPGVGIHLCAGQNNNVCFSTDVGMTLALTPAVDFAMGGSPELMGLNVHYFF